MSEKKNTPQKHAHFDLERDINLPILRSREKHAITLTCGAKITPQNLWQKSVYNCYSEGHPTPRHNKQRLKMMTGSLRQSETSNEGSYLIEPKSIFVYETSNHPLLNCERLPFFFCKASFTSPYPHSKISRISCSSLSIIWFQDEMAMPIDPEIIEQIQEIDWDKHAQIMSKEDFMDSMDF